MKYTAELKKKIQFVKSMITTALGATNKFLSMCDPSKKGSKSDQTWWMDTLAEYAGGPVFFT